MKIHAPLVMLCLALCVPAAGAEGWTVRLKVVNGRVTYSHTQKLAVGAQNDYVGKAGMRGPGPVLQLIFNSYLNKPEDGTLRLDYQVEMGGDKLAMPPLQLQGKVPLRPGKPVLAAEAGGWKLIFELEGGSEGRGSGAAGVLETRLKCGRASYPARFLYVPGEQYSAVTYNGPEAQPRKFMAGLLPNGPSADGTFLLQYALQLKEGRENLADSKGELILVPGGAKVSAAAGKGCVFSARALR